MRSQILLSGASIVCEELDRVLKLVRVMKSDDENNEVKQRKLVLLDVLDPIRFRQHEHGETLI